MSVYVCVFGLVWFVGLFHPFLFIGTHERINMLKQRASGDKSWGRQDPF